MVSLLQNVLHWTNFISDIKCHTSSQSFVHQLYTGLLIDPHSGVLYLQRDHLFPFAHIIHETELFLGFIRYITFSLLIFRGFPWELGQNEWHMSMQCEVDDYWKSLTTSKQAQESTFFIICKLFISSLSCNLQHMVRCLKHLTGCQFLFLHILFSSFFITFICN